MTTNHTPSVQKSPFAGLQPASAWILIFGFAIVTAVLALAGAGKILNLVYPAAALAIGVFLYYRAPHLYIGFHWWIWFLTAFVRRIADYRSSFTDPSPILIAPYLVSLVSLITLIKYLPKTRDGMPFVLAAIAVFYGFLLGLVTKPPFAVTKGFLDWMAPIAIGFHFFTYWRDYPSFRKTTQQAFTWGILVMGLYGIYQFVSLPDWDRKWLIDTTLISAAGDPDQEAPRIWSTMQSGEPFAAFMAGALLLLLTSKGAFVVPASAAGYLSFLLAMVRSGWLGWFAGLLALVGSLKAKFQMRLIAMVLILGLCVVPLATMEPFAARIQTRLDTLSDVQNDSSASGRQQGFKDNAESALTTVVGQGVESVTMDNGFFALFIYLGLLGAIPYLGGLLLLTVKVFQSTAGNADPFIGTAFAIATTALVRFPVNGAQFGISGIMLWGFLGLGLAAAKYHKHQHTIEP